MKPSKKGNLKLLWKIHHWAGLYTGIIIGVICFTGAVAVFIPEIDLLIQKNSYSISSTPSDGIPKIGKALAATKMQHPEMSRLLIYMPEKTGQYAVFNFAVKGKDKASDKSYHFLVDPGKDKIVGSKNLQNSFVNYLRQIHVRLYDGFWGRQLVGLGGIALVVVTITGLLIYSGFMKKQPYPTIRHKKGTRIQMADWHKIIGISALAFNLMIAATGAWLGLQPKLMQWFDIKPPNYYEAAQVVTAKADTEISVQWDDVFKAAKEEFPDLKPGYIKPSEDGTAVITINGSVDGQVYEKNIHSLVLSKTTLKPVFKFDARNASFAGKFYSIQEALHFGDFGGLALKIVYAILGLTGSFLSISGFVVYLYRTDKKQPRGSSLKIIFVYCIGLLLLLSLIAVISILVGYKQAASLAAYIVNGSLVLSIGYFTWKYVTNKPRPKTNKTA